MLRFVTQLAVLVLRGTLICFDLIWVWTRGHGNLVLVIFLEFVSNGELIFGLFTLFAKHRATLYLAFKLIKEGRILFEDNLRSMGSLVVVLHVRLLQRNRLSVTTQEGKPLLAYKRRF